MDCSMTMDHTSQSQYNSHHHQQQQIRVIKPNRHYHGTNNSFDSAASDRSYQRSRPFPSTVTGNHNNNNNYQDTSSGPTPPMPAVMKILAKSNKPQVEASSDTNTVTQVNKSSIAGGGGVSIGKTSTIVANRGQPGVVRNAELLLNRSSNNNNTSINTSTSNISAPLPGSKTVGSSFSILEKQLARMHIVPSVEARERDLAHNCTKLLDGEFNLQDTNVLERCLLADTVQTGGGGQGSSGTSSSSSGSSSGQSFCIVGAVGLDGVGKSSLLNMIANKKVFKSHASLAEEIQASSKNKSSTAANVAANTDASSIINKNVGKDNPLTHVTSGVDLHITAERLFLLDTQPLLSASILDEFLRNSVNNGQSSFGGGPYNHHHHHHHHNNHLPMNGGSGNPLASVVGFDITEPENFAYIYSMQLLTFMFAICDHLVLVLDSCSLDVYLLKLVASALMMVGDSVPKANLIIYMKPEPKVAIGSTSAAAALHLNSASSASSSSSSTMCPKPNTSKDSGRSESLSRPPTSTLSSAPPLPPPIASPFTFTPPSRSATHNRMYDLLKNTIIAILGPTVNVDFITDERRLLATVMKPPPRNLLLGDAQSSRPIQYTTERAWFHSVQRFWENSIRKSSLFADYARYLP